MDHSAWLIPVTCVILGAIVSFWLDMRKENRRMDSETQQRHVENQVRFTKLETQLQPITKWFNNGRNKDEEGDTGR